MDKEIDNFMKRNDITEEELEKRVQQYESGNFECANSSIFSGSHLDAVDKKHITNNYDASRTQ